MIGSLKRMRGAFRFGTMFFEVLFVHWQLKSNWNLNKKLFTDSNNKLTNTGGGACLGTVGIRIVMSGVDE